MARKWFAQIRLKEMDTETALNIKENFFNHLEGNSVTINVVLVQKLNLHFIEIPWKKSYYGRCFDGPILRAVHSVANWQGDKLSNKILEWGPVSILKKYPQSVIATRGSFET